MDTVYLRDLIDQYMQKKELLYQTWFTHSEERLKPV